MKKNTLILALFSFLVMSCGPKDNEFCKCLEAGEKLDQHSSSILNGEPEEGSFAEQVRLRNEMDSLCKDYETMDGPTMQELKKDCENN